MWALVAIVAIGIGIVLLGIRQLDKVRTGVSPAEKAVEATLLLIVGASVLCLPATIVAIKAGMTDFALLLGIGINISIIAGAVAAAMSATKEGKKKLVELQLQKDEEARRLKAEQQAEEQRKSEEAARLQEERARRERKERERMQAERLAEEIRRQNEEEATRLQGERRREQEEIDKRETVRAGQMKIQPRNPALMAMLVMQHERAQQETDPDVRSWLMRDIQRLQQRLGNAGALAEELIGELAEIVRTAFLVKSCPRCHENKMALIEVSPNAKSIEYVCIHCERRQRAAANSPDTGRAKSLVKFIIVVLGKVWFKTMRDGYRCTFSVPEAVMPYQQAARPGQISVAIRGQVWRRDNGRCVQCGSRESLHFDHIIPVAKGGATIVSNLQLLCQSCNLSKGAKI